MNYRKILEIQNDEFKDYIDNISIAECIDVELRLATLRHIAGQKSSKHCCRIK